jgi:serine/threonine protein kinase/tetratricopeptide (TPR) repeat protein
MDEPPSFSLPDPASGKPTDDSVTDRLCADLVQRWQRGERVPVEAYLRQYPNLESGECAFELILTEIILRRDCGDDPPLGEYLWRFPHFEERLRRHFTLHAGLAITALSESGLPIEVNLPQELSEGLPTVPGFEVVEKIGRGGMGIVYKARETSLGRFVALKLLRDDHARAPDRLTRFLREARTTSALNHPGICTVHALCYHDGRPFIVMELIEGLTMRSLIAQRPEPESITRLIGQAAQALAAAHAAGVVHRDIKPENIMIRRDGHVKVVDFGLARLLPAVTIDGVTVGSDCPTDLGTTAGTLTYMSPEQTRGEPVGSATDVFSLGIVAYELITGQHPFAAGSVLGTFSSIASKPPTDPRRYSPTLSSEFNDLLMQMLEKDPRLRPTAAEIGADLARETRTKTTLANVEHLELPERKTVGRKIERQALRDAFDTIDRGNGLLLCVSGEPGIGKTTLVEEWLNEFSAGDRVVGIGKGHCSERLAGTGSYLPVLEALEELLRGEAGSLAGRIMRDVAPAWYAQVSSQLSDSSLNLQVERVELANQERMKREFLAFVTQIGRRLPLIFFFDDLHWADASTVDLVAWLGRHFNGLRILLITTYRPTEMHSGDNSFVPVQLELEQHGVCRELPLVFLTYEEVENYLSLGFQNHEFPTDFAIQLHAKTEGNPLFMAELVHHLRDRGVIASQDGHWRLTQAIPDFQKELPVSVRSLIRRQFDQVDEADRRLLSVGSVQGYEFDAVLAADVLERNVADVEERLELLDRVHGLVRLVRELEFPDGTLTLRYRFVHVLYQNSLYEAVPPSRRAEWSAAVANALLAHYGRQNAVVASEAALLFQKARSWAQAAECFYLAARYPLRLHAHREAAVLARCGLEMLARLPETPERARQEVRLQFALGLALQPSEGFAAPVVVEAYRRARSLSHVEMEVASRSPLLWGLWSFYILRGEHHSAREIAIELSSLARDQTDPLVSLAADHSMGYSLMMLGQPFAAWPYLGRDLPEETQAVYGRDIGIPFRAHGSVVLWLLGFPDQAVERSHRAAALARKKMDLYGLSISLFNAAKVHQFRREAGPTAEFAHDLMTLAQEQGYPVWFAAGTILAGWAIAQQGQWDLGVTRIREGIAAFLANGAAMMHPYFLSLLAETLDASGNVEEGLDVLERAFAATEESGELYYEAELHRLRGDLLLKLPGQHDRTDEALASFQTAIETAREQKSHSLELRAAVSAVKLERQLGCNCREVADPRIRLEPICDRFTEGFDTSDWRAAVALRDNLK